MTVEPNKPETVSPASGSEQPMPELEHAEIESFAAQAEKQKK
jgi:hypothetical protein